jgi:hypothetical protein
MSTVTINPTTALKNFLSSEAVVKGFKVNEVISSKALSNGTELESFKQSMITAEHINHGIKWFASSEGIKQRKVDGMRLKVWQLGHEAYDIKKSQFYKYNQCYVAHLEDSNILKDYISYVTAEKKQGEDERFGVVGFLKYIKEESNPEKKDKKEWAFQFTMGKGKSAIRCRATATGEIDMQGNTSKDCLMAVDMFYAILRDKGVKAKKETAPKKGMSLVFESIPPTV